MPLPRPASPRALFSDMRAFVRQRSRHQVIAAFFAMLIPMAIVVVFSLDSHANIMPGPQLIYVESWPESRTDEEILAKQKADQELREAALEHRRQQYERLEKGLQRFGL